MGALWAQADKLSDAEFAAYVVSGFPDVVDPFVVTAGTLAATWFEQALPSSTYVAKTAELPPVEMLTKSAQWALSATGTEGRERLEGTVQRAVFDGARETTLLNIKETGSRWARYASANACAFCRLLATKTDRLYTSENAALRVVGRGKDFSSNFREDGSRKAGGQAGGIKTRGSRNVGEKYHDHCHCVAVEVREGQTYELPDYVAQWQDTYRTAFNAVPEGTRYEGNNVLKAVLSQWRQIDGSA